MNCAVLLCYIASCINVVLYGASVTSRLVLVRQELGASVTSQPLKIVENTSSFGLSPKVQKVGV